MFESLCPSAASKTKSLPFCTRKVTTRVPIERAAPYATAPGKYCVKYAERKYFLPSSLLLMAR